MKNIKKILVQLEDRGEVDYEISHRGGHYGLASSQVVALLFPNKSYEVQQTIEAGMPSKFGAYCNYLGGGIRGSVCGSGFDKSLPKYATDALDNFQRACIARYLEIEKEWSEDPDSFTDEWNEEGTRLSRAAGVESAY